MGQEQSMFEKFTWKVENLSRLKTHEIYSEPFVIGGYPWKICLYSKRDDEDDSTLAIDLEVVKTANMFEGWSRYVRFKLLLFNQLDSNKTISTDYDYCEFNASETSCCFDDLINLDELNDPNKGFMLNDACIVGAEIFVCESSCEKQVNQANYLVVSPVSIEPAKKVDAELGCAALGRLINFFKTRKVKDMNEQVCKELQVLWDQLQKIQFDVSWLKPHVQSALGMKTYVEKVQEAEKLKENMRVLELEMERLKEKLVAAELNIDVERDLLNAKGFKEIGLDSDLGCVIWRP